MALTHAQPGDVIDVRPLGERLRESSTHAILRTEALELMRVILRAGTSGWNASFLTPFFNSSGSKNCGVSCRMV